jgi:hypothetical protein
MDAIIGKYRVRIEDSHLILTHSAGISFDLTHEEALGLWSFINVYRQSIEQKRDTETRLASVVLPHEMQSVEEL